MKRRLSGISISLITLALLGVVALTALARTRPFHLVEHGTLTEDQPGHFVAEGTGTATHLGSVAVHRTFTLRPSTDGSGLVDVQGEATLVAANGDELRTGIEGTLNPETNHAILIYGWEGGTGRFVNATGTTTWQVDINKDQTYDVVADGAINY